MSSPPDILTGMGSIPHIDSPVGTTSNSRSSSPSPKVHPRSKTAPPPSTQGEMSHESTFDSSPETISSPLSTTPPTDNSFPTHNAEASTSNPRGSTSQPDQPAIPDQHSSPGIRRSSSSLSNGTREKKRLRFTPLTHSDAENGEGVTFPGTGYGYRSSDHAGGSKGVPRDQMNYLKSDPGTPNLSETADQIRRTLSLANIDSLLLLSQNPSGEREKLLAEVSKVGRDLVWRGEGERPVLPSDGERAILLALKRGMRSFILAFSVRAGVNVLLLLLRTLRRHKLRFALIRHAIFGAEPFRFGAMIGTFTFLNTLTLHLLRLAPPLAYIKRRLRAPLFERATFGPPEREGAEGERRWQAAVAGAVGSLGLLWESKNRRTGVAQQMFVRGLQGSYNHYTPRLGIHIPHGDILLFGACSAQIMFAFLLNPETIPREYNAWILNASRVPDWAVLANRTSVRERYIDPVQIQRALHHRALTPNNKALLLEYLEKLKNGFRTPATIPCAMLHPWSNSCTETSFRRYFSVFKLMLPVYSALHLIPMLVLRRHHFLKDPLKMMAKSIIGIGRSCSFLGIFVVIYQALFCLRTHSIEEYRLPEMLKSLLKRKETFWLVGFSTCLSLLVEEKKRRAELAMYVLPRALESAWSSARKKAWVPLVPFGETILGAVAMAMVMDAYKHSPASLSGLVRRLLFQLVGPV